MAEACLRLLGPVDVVDEDGEPVALGGPKERLVLAVLGVHAGEVVSEDRLIDALWGDNPPRTAAKTLQSYVSRLRRTLGGCAGLAIQSVPSGYVFHLGPHGSDVARLELLVADARKAGAGDDHEQAAVLLSQAERLWRGPVLGDLAGEPFAVAEAARLEELRTVVIEERIEAELGAGRHGAVVAELESLTARYPLRERLWAARMLALYRCGRQADALRAFQELRIVLAEELGLDPSPSLVSLEQAILSQSPELGAPPAATGSVESAPRAGRAGPPDHGSAPNLPSGVVTFLLTDIEGSTSLWEDDPQAMDRALRAHDAVLAALVDANRGVLLKDRGEGDSTFSVFWRATDAANAAIAAQAELERIQLSVGLRVRMAIHTGEAFERDGDYYGPAVNRAARLRSVADGGEIVVSGTAAELLADHTGGPWELVALGERQLRDLARPALVWALAPPGVGRAASRRPDRGRVVRPPAMPPALDRHEVFVARGAERARLEELWERAVDGSRQAVFVAGEPGIGKTALAAAAARRAVADGGLVLFGRCDEDLGVPHQPFAEAVRALLVSGSVDATRVPGVAELARLVPDLGALVPVVAAPTSGDPDTERWRLFEAVTALLSAASQSSPIVLVLDDLHWAEKPTLLLLRHLLRADAPLRLLVIGTYRDSELARTHPLADLLADLRRDGGAERIALGGFDTADVEALLEVAAGHDLDERAVELAHALKTGTGGNPFFCREVLRHLAESGTIYETDGRWTSDVTVAELALPEGVREVIGRRLSRLSDDANEVLRIAAVVGQSFAVGLVEQVVDLGGDAVLDALDAAVAAALVNETAGGYEFAHALVRHTLLDELSATRITRLHRRIGEALEAFGDTEDNVEALARHFLAAAAAGEEERAARYALAAARQALDRGAYEDVAAWANRGLEAVEGRESVALSEMRSDLWAAVAASGVLANNDYERSPAFQAAEHARRAGDARRLATAAILSQQIETGLGAADAGCEQLLREALAQLPPTEEALRAAVLARLAHYLAVAVSDRAGALSHSAEALAIARTIGDNEGLIDALTARCAALESHSGDHEGFALAEELSGLRPRSATLEFFRLLYVGTFRLELGDRDGFQSCLSELDDLVRIAPDTLPRSYAAAWRGTLHLLDGEWEELDALINVAFQTELAKIGTLHPNLLATWAGLAFQSAREQGRATELMPLLRAAFEANPNVPVFEAALAAQAAEDGSYQEAEELLEAWRRSDFAPLPDDTLRAVGVAICAEAAVRVQQVEALSALARHLEGFAGRAVAARGQTPLGAVDRYRAMLATVLGQFDEAERLFESALSLEEQGLRSRPLATRTRLWYGRMLVEKGETERAERMLRRTLADAEDLQMPGIVREATALLGTVDDGGPAAVSAAR